MSSLPAIQALLPRRTPFSSAPARPAQVETSLLRLGEQQVALEGVAATAETVAALATGAAASRATMQQLGPEQVEAIFDDMAETAAEAQQVQDALAVPLGAAAEVDDDELEAELQVTRQKGCIKLAVVEVHGSQFCTRLQPGW